MKRNVILFLALGSFTLWGCAPKTKNVEQTETKEQNLIVLLGSYGDLSEETIKAYYFDEYDGTFSYICGLSGLSNPSFLVPAQDGKHLFSVKEDEGETAGVYAIAFDKEKRKMTLLNEVLTHGGAPCNITLDPSEHFVLTANYFGGNVSVIAIDEEYRLIEPIDIIPFTGKSVDPERQTKPYLHCVRFSPDGRYMLADDLGTDRIHIFPVNEQFEEKNPNSLLKLDKMVDVQVEPGNGPRHIVFHPNKRYAYLINELSGNVIAFDYSEGNLTGKQYIAADTVNAKGSADIQLSPDGKFLYASNRLKADGIAIFQINEDGTLTKMGYQLTGIHPRNFALSPNGKYVLVACRDSNCVQIFERDAQTGQLTDTGQTIEMSKPVCVRFIER